jgi:tol-pal system protein YbgF
MQVVRKFGGFSGRKRGRSAGSLALVSLCFVGFIGCATTATTSGKVDEAAAVQRLRAENIANQRKLEELENQVFVLNSALENRRRAEPPPPPSAPSLPEIKLTRGERLPPPDNSPASTPASLVDETEVEYAGAAAEHGSTKRPVLRLWGAGASGEEAAVNDESSFRSTGPERVRAQRDGADARRDSKDRGRVAGRRLALARPAGEVNPPSAAASIMADPAANEADTSDPGGSRPASQSAHAPSKSEPIAPPRSVGSARGGKFKEKAKDVRPPVVKAQPAPAAPAGKKNEVAAEPRPQPQPEAEVPSPTPVKLHPVAALPAKTKAPAAHAPKGSSADLYNNALLDLRAGRHDDAIAGLRTFVRLHAQHDLADNAQYWLGECFYDRKDYASAAREFAKVASEFPTGNKVPDAQLKLGLSYAALGNARAARTALSDVVRRFAQHPAASLAEAKLAALGGADTAAALTRRPDSKEVR